MSTNLKVSMNTDMELVARIVAICDVIQNTPGIFERQNIVCRCHGCIEVGSFEQLLSSLAYKHPLNSILNTIFAMLIEDAIKEEKYYPKNMQWLINDTKYGIWLEITSYVPVKYYGLLSEIISKILKLSVLREKFNVFKSMYGERLEFFKESHPSGQALFYLSTLLSEKSWAIDELSKTNSDVTFEMIQKFIYEFVRNMYVKSFMYGEINIQEAVEIFEHLQIHVEMENDVQKIKQAELLLDREIKLKDDIHALFEVKNNSHNVSSVLVYLQLGKLTMKEKLNVALICYIMSQECSIFFRKLERSIDGTLVKERIKKEIHGLIIIVESCINQYIIENYIDQFISDMLDYIKKLSEENFETFKIELVTQFNKIELFVNDEWTDIFSNEIYSPVRREAEEWHIMNIKQEELIQFYKQNIHDNKAKMSVHVSSEHVLSKQKDVKKTDSSETSKTSTSEESSDEKRKLVRKSKIHKRKLIDKTVTSKKAKMAVHMFSKHKDTEKDMEKDNSSSETLLKTSEESSGEEKKLIRTSKIHEPSTSTSTQVSSASIPVSIKTSKIKLMDKTLSKVTKKLENWSNKKIRSNISPEQFTKIVDIALFKKNQDFYE